MATKNFEVQQLFKALRAGVISQEFFTDQMDELMGSNGAAHEMVPNVFAHRGDQLIYVIEGSATCRVSGKECTVKAGDFLTIPAGAPHTLRTGNEKLFALTVLAPPEN